MNDEFMIDISKASFIFRQNAGHHEKVATRGGNNDEPTIDDIFLCNQFG